MSARELVVLGTSSQVPTRERNHNGYVLLWDGTGVLFDPGEGTQRQLTHAGIAVSRLQAILVTHFHGDHCLGLPGVLQRRSADLVVHPVDLAFPASGQPYLDRLRYASVFEEHAAVRELPVDSDGPVPTALEVSVTARRLDHAPDTFGWRIEEPAGRHMLPEALAAAGIAGPAVGRLIRLGELEVGGRRVRVEEVSEHRPGQAMAFVMDTGLCDAAFELAAGVDLLVCESTFAGEDAALAAAYHHLTAPEAARIALESGARRLVLTHFSQRYKDIGPLLAEARAIFPETVAVRDLDRVEVPPRVVASPQSRSGDAPPVR